MNYQARASMTENVFVTLWSESLQSAFDKMRHLHIRHLPVVDQNGNIVGMLSERDLQRAMTVVPPSIANRDQVAEFDPDFIVRDFMSQEVHTISEKANLKEAAQAMNSLKVSSLVVTNANREMVGILTNEDLLVVLIGLLNRQPSVVDEFKNLCYNSPLGAIANLLNQSGI